MGGWSPTGLGLLGAMDKPGTLVDDHMLEIRCLDTTIWYHSIRILLNDDHIWYDHMVLPSIDHMLFDPYIDPTQ